ncbi:uncharacterized protein LOC127263623 [Andrographis paniculata]|uniref:uncharacterized protein LOC127263623 n=1 Tax=Andrographis paniculata TaxID=175694 RepID=UPI0021E7B01C|nr:uncharacterized protein LOC127263623 [Andrographis paniculata]
MSRGSRSSQPTNVVRANWTYEQEETFMHTLWEQFQAENLAGTNFAPPIWTMIRAEFILQTNTPYLIAQLQEKLRRTKDAYNKLKKLVVHTTGLGWDASTGLVAADEERKVDWIRVPPSPDQTICPFGVLSRDVWQTATGGEGTVIPGFESAMNGPSVAGTNDVGGRSWRGRRTSESDFAMGFAGIGSADIGSPSIGAGLSRRPVRHRGTSSQTEELRQVLSEEMAVIVDRVQENTRSIVSRREETVQLAREALNALTDVPGRAISTARTHLLVPEVHEFFLH